MALSLEQYATQYLDGRNLPWPGAPKIEPVKARPHLAPCPAKAVLWTVYGTLLAVPGGELAFEAQIDFAMDAALDKTILEFKMWNSMSRKPGAPSAYMKELYTRALTNLQLIGVSGEKHPEVASERVWDDIVKKLMQKEYQYDAALYGSYDEFLKKLAYFFHASIQGVGAYPNAAAAIRSVGQAGRRQGLLADGQSFTPAQLTRALQAQEPGFDWSAEVPAAWRFLSAERKAKKPSETLFKAAVAACASAGLAPSDVLHVGSSIPRDVAPAKKHGFRTALYAGDKNSLVATAEQMKDPATRPDLLLTDLAQLADIFA